MAKKDSKAAKAAKVARMAEKNAKNKAKSENKNRKQVAKLGGGDDDDESVDIEALLAEFAKQQAEFEKITIKQVSKPTPRQGAVLIQSPEQGLGRKSGELLLFGGESLVNGLTTFYNDLYIYSTDNGIWRQVCSPNSPLPRSGHAFCAHPNGVAVLFGGEFSSPKQSTFYHYGDTWVFEAAAREWTKVDLKKAPLARSGHRMVAWKNYIIMHGGFRDLAQSTSYLSDLWAFDVKDYKWHEIEIPATMARPDARSGHSFLPLAEGALLWGGYCKVKAARGLQKGKVHQDAWTLLMKSDLKGVRWERRRKGACHPSQRIGCYMVPHRARGLLFGGVYDTSETEESLDSVFFNTLHSYQPDTNRWAKLMLRSPKQRSATSAQKKNKEVNRDGDLQANLAQILQSMDLSVAEALDAGGSDSESENESAGKPQYTISDQFPHPRFNSAVAVANDSLYIYGGIFERGDREFALDSFYSIDLTKLDGVKVFWENLGLTSDGEEKDEDDDGNDDDDDDDDDEETEDQLLEALDNPDSESESEAEEPEIPDPRPWLPHPRPFQSVTAFYRENVDRFVEWALKQDRDARAKELKRNAFELCENRWWERREAVCVAEDELDEAGGVAEVIERVLPRGGAGRR